VESEEFVLAAEFYSEAQARPARALLKSAAIPAFLKGNATAIQLMVHPSFLAEAQELLDSPVSEEALLAEATALPPESAPGEDADDDRLGEKK
jgi:hypothetical protein